MNTCSVSTAKCTIARRRSALRGSRSRRYCRLGVLGGLAGEVVLDLGGGDRDAVEEQPDVDGLRRRRVVRQLAGDRQPVGRVLGLVVGVEPGRRAEVGEADLGLLVAGVHDPVPQHVDRPPAVQLLRESSSERPLRLVGRRVRPAHLLPLLRLRRPDEREQLRRVERQVGREVVVPIGGVAHLDRRVATRRHERLADRRLERPLGRSRHRADPNRPHRTDDRTRPRTRGRGPTEPCDSP